ncbi:hypothetical protein NPIL_319301 [Nephila pilipes]|uniref:Uncharacterized protein n=1 Tax=Nephila pilipes TaxID=299642 RepID=A0A8X6TAQ6_NEPPI|nr:hypothetical protein NPIL_319301 [Nephila pilipes]
MCVSKNITIRKWLLDIQKQVFTLTQLGEVIPGVIPLLPKAHGQNVFLPPRNEIATRKEEKRTLVNTAARDAKKRIIIYSSKLLPDYICVQLQIVKIGRRNG